MFVHQNKRGSSPSLPLSPLPQAFGFINLILWVGNLWFVFKETGIIAPFMRAPPPQDKAAAPDAYGQQAGYEQDPYASNQGGYQPDYNQQQGYNQVRGGGSQSERVQVPGGSGPGSWLGPGLILYHCSCVSSLICCFQDAEYGQGYGQQGAPTSFSNQMWAYRQQVSPREKQHNL